MRRKLFFYILIIHALFSFSCSKIIPNDSYMQEPHIIVRNTSVIALTADVVSFDVTIRERGDSIEEVTDAGNKRSNKVKAILKSIGIDNFATQSFSVSPRYAYIRIDLTKSRIDDYKNEEKIFKYNEYIHNFEVKITDIGRNPELPGLAIDRILSVGNAEISNLRFSINDNHKANAAVRRVSAQAAMKKIYSYADGCNVAVKGVSTMNEGIYTRDTGVTMEREAKVPANGVLYEMASDFKLSGNDTEDADDSSTRIASDKINVNAEVNYKAAIGKKPYNTLDVSGFFQVKASPDVAEFEINVIKKGNDIPVIAKQVADIVKGVVDRLDGKCDLTTLSYYIGPEFKDYENSSSSWHSDKASQIQEYTCEQVIKVKVTDFDQDNKLGNVIDLIKKGISNELSIGNINYSISDNTVFVDEARKGATANAKEKCEIYADGAKIKVSGVFSIYENYSTWNTPIDGDKMYYADSVRRIYKSGDIQPGQTVIFPNRVTVRSQVSVTAKI